MTFDRSAFTSYMNVSPKFLELGAESSAMIVGIGDVTLKIIVGKKPRTCILKNVQHVPNLRYQLIFVSTMSSLGIRTSFDNINALLTHKESGKLVAVASLKNSGLYVLNVVQERQHSDTALIANLSLWHERLAHVDTAGIKVMADRKVVKGLIYSSSKVLACEGCVLGKSCRSPIPKASDSKTNRLLELVHSDVLVPIEVPSIGSSRYAITFIDDYSTWTVQITMRFKSEAFECFKKFRTLAQTHTNQRLQKLYMNNTVHEVDDSSAEKVNLKVLRSGNGGEYLSNMFKKFLLDHGAHHELTVAYTPQQNSVAERMNRTILHLVRSIMHHKNIEKRFWAESMATAVHTRNKVTSRSLPNNITCYHRWYGEAPDLSHIRVFGSKCWYTIPKKKVKKLDPRARLAIMMGYSSRSKGYKLWDSDSCNFVVSRDVTFQENDTEEVLHRELIHDR